MPALIVIGCIILFLALVLSLRIKLTVIYRDSLVAYWKFMFFKRMICPENEKQRGPHSMSKWRARRIKKKHQDDQEEKRRRNLQRELRKKKERQGKREKETFSDVLEVLGYLKELLSVFLKHLFKHWRVDVARFKINVATGEAATTAIAYGAVCEAVSVLLTILEPLRGFSSPKAKDIAISADYLSENTTADIKIVLSVRIWQAIHIVLATLITYVKQLVAIKS